MYIYVYIYVNVYVCVRRYVYTHTPLPNDAYIHTKKYAPEMRECPVTLSVVTASSEPAAPRVPCRGSTCMYIHMYMYVYVHTGHVYL